MSKSETIQLAAEISSEVYSAVRFEVDSAVESAVRWDVHSAVRLAIDWAINWEVRSEADLVIWSISSAVDSAVELKLCS